LTDSLLSSTILKSISKGGIIMAKKPVTKKTTARKPARLSLESLHKRLLKVEKWCRETDQSFLKSEQNLEGLRQNWKKAD
jgi:hypothetical protein